MVDCGALDSLVICLEEFDPTVKEAAAWALGYIARHNAGKEIILADQKNSYWLNFLYIPILKKIWLEILLVLQNIKGSYVI